MKKFLSVVLLLLIPFTTLSAGQDYRNDDEWELIGRMQCHNMTASDYSTTDLQYSQTVGDVVVDGKRVIIVYRLLDSMYYVMLYIDDSWLSVMLSSREVMGSLIVFVIDINDGPDRRKIAQCEIDRKDRIQSALSKK